ncbi:hypothetical protein L596_021292 [Steinernema carpocapsae]|uniref:Serine/threonine-protein kinase PLK n=1 Tax=Steinernema carpocapsae TaxID=34508 RepID=A0A4U5MIB1_STECR|nr:hypothetical protein L596_021292 [Steinernema carpocapsae]
MSSRTAQIEMPSHIYDNKTDTRYGVGRFLGKGGFARCYELVNEQTRQHVAGKIVAKKALEKKSQRDKMVQEIQIHQQMNHEHVVKMFGHFEDQLNIYIILEVCDNRSLMELHKRRKYVCEEEARYFLGQIVDGVAYLHDRHIIHRDLKLGNLFLNKDMKVKIGDFGLATEVTYDGERKKTLCGTPNYIAPEMLCKKGHSYEVDIWAIGCILYTLLVGKPPFETQSLQETYDRIKKNLYTIPPRLPRYCGNLIDNLLNSNPQKRPTIHQIRSSEFFKQGYYPTALPQSCLTTAPKFDFVKRPTRQPLAPAQPGSFASHVESPLAQPQATSNRVLRPVDEHPEKMIVDDDQNDQNVNPRSSQPEDKDYYLSDLLKMVNNCMINFKETQPNLDDLLDPAAMPIFWISKWVDYSDKYGLGYQLNDNSVGVLFNDKTKLMMNHAGEQLQYADQRDREQFYVAQNFPEHMKKKVTLLKYFRSYMMENLLKAGGNIAVRAGDELERLPVVRDWKRTRQAIALHLTNGTLQTNFFEDHEKFILCPLMSAITCITKKGEVYTITTQKMAEHGYPRELYNHLKSIKTLIEKLISGDSDHPAAQQRRPVAPLGARGRSASARGMTNNRM